MRKLYVCGTWRGCLSLQNFPRTYPDSSIFSLRCLVDKSNLSPGWKISVGRHFVCPCFLFRSICSTTSHVLVTIAYNASAISLAAGTSSLRCPRFFGILGSHARFAKKGANPAVANLLLLITNSAKFEFCAQFFLFSSTCRPRLHCIHFICLEFVLVVLAVVKRKSVLNVSVRPSERKLFTECLHL